MEFSNSLDSPERGHEHELDTEKETMCAHFVHVDQLTESTSLNLKETLEQGHWPNNRLI